MKMNRATRCTDLHCRFLDVFVDLTYSYLHDTQLKECHPAHVYSLSAYYVPYATAH